MGSAAAAANDAAVAVAPAPAAADYHQQQQRQQQQQQLHAAAPPSPSQPSLLPSSSSSSFSPSTSHDFDPSGVAGPDTAKLAAAIDSSAVAKVVAASANLHRTLPHTLPRDGALAQVAAADARFAAHCVRTARIVTLSPVLAACARFLQHKLTYGSPAEIDFYDRFNMSVGDFVAHLIADRPFAFVGPDDCTAFHFGDGGSVLDGRRIWDRIGKAPDDHDDDDGGGGVANDVLGGDGVALLGGVGLGNYMSYHEMQLAAFIGVSSPTAFFNAGRRDNRGVAHSPDRYGDPPFEPRGVYVGLVGARFERAARMEREYLVVDRRRSTPARGFGPNAAASNPAAAARLAILADLLDYADPTTTSGGGGGARTFPAFDDVDAFVRQREASGLRQQHFVRIADDAYFNMDAYRRRIVLTIATLLLEANDRASAASAERLRSEQDASPQTPQPSSSSYADPNNFNDVGEDDDPDATAESVPGGALGVLAHVRVVGFGLGVWQLHPAQTQAFADAAAAAVASTHLPYVAAVELCWLGDAVSACHYSPPSTPPSPTTTTPPIAVHSGDALPSAAGNPVQLLLSRANPADPLPPPPPALLSPTRKLQRLLVASYAWDSNALPGNEYWRGDLDTSGDAAAAAASLIAEVQNPLVNRGLLENVRAFRFDVRALGRAADAGAAAAAAAAAGIPAPAAVTAVTAAVAAPYDALPAYEAYPAAPAPAQAPALAAPAAAASYPLAVEPEDDDDDDDGANAPVWIAAGSYNHNHHHHHHHPHHHHQQPHQQPYASAHAAAASAADVVAAHAREAARARPGGVG
ncbi:hypothetical protein DFJ73DRAFT_900977 [Zopfochytrium polystomum]|nr:hypothetical protein DFJ73DRAFT_900977 [Zopfochytrium polystomum]